MANSVSAEKRICQSEKHRIQNKSKKARIRTEVKKFEQAVDGGNVASAETQLRLVYKLLDKAAKEKILHPNRAAHKKSQLHTRLNAVRAKGEKAS